MLYPLSSNQFERMFSRYPLTCSHNVDTNDVTKSPQLTEADANNKTRIIGGVFCFGFSTTILFIFFQVNWQVFLRERCENAGRPRYGKDIARSHDLSAHPAAKHGQPV